MSGLSKVASDLHKACRSIMCRYNCVKYYKAAARIRTLRATGSRERIKLLMDAQLIANG